jgi:hypothetical protein
MTTMFRGDSAELREVLRRALGSARALDQPRAGSEHLLLTPRPGTVRAVDADP